MDMYSIMYIEGEHSDRSMRDAEFFFKRNGLLEESEALALPFLTN